MEQKKRNDKIKAPHCSDSCSDGSREEDVSPCAGPSSPRLKTELKRLIESLGDTTEENSVLEVHMKEVKIKEHKLSSQSDCLKERKKINDDDSARTDLGIPPLPDCEVPKLKEVCRRKSVIVRDHTNKHKLYVPGRIKSQFFICPHRAMDCKQEALPSPLPGVRRNVNRYHYNHYGWRNPPRRHYDNNNCGFFKRLCAKKKRRPTKSVKSESITRQPRRRRERNEFPSRTYYNQTENCYCIDVPERIDEASVTSHLYDCVDVESQHRRCLYNEMDIQNDGYNPKTRYTGSHGQIQFVAPEDHRFYKNQRDISDESFPGKSKKAEIIENRCPESAYPPGYTQALCKPERVDIYLFDHQDSRYFHTTDNPPPIHTEMAVHTTEEYATLFWAEVFGVIHIGFAFVIALILQLLKFILVAILRPILTGPIQLLSDYLLKPLLTILFNGLLQPVVIFLYNIATSIRDLLQPIAKGIGYVIREASVPIQAFRVVEVKGKTNNGPFYAPGVKV